MPTYEYRCPAGHEFERFQRMSDEPRAACPTCGEEATRLLSAGAGFLFKGDGFYITDYRSDAYRAAAKKEGGSGSGGSDGASPTSPAPASPSAAPASPSPSKAPAKPASSSGKASSAAPSSD